MYCGECGTKNDLGSKFCEKCGHELETTNVETKKVEKKPKKKMGIKAYIIIAVIVLAVIAYFVGAYFTNPKRIAEDYFKAIVNVDGDKLYSYLEKGNSEFTTKEIFNKIIEDASLKEKEKLVNYNISEMEKSSDGMTGKFKITYLLEGDSDSDTYTVTFVKEKSKKFLIFDNWKVKVDNYKLVDDFTLKVMKGSKVEIEGISLDSKYINKDKSTDKLDIYDMPALFNTTYNIKVSLPIGIEAKDTMRVYSDSSYTFDSVSKNDITEEVSLKITDKAKSFVQDMYNNVLGKKTWEEIKTTYEINGIDTTSIKTMYEKMLTTFESASNKLTAITFDKMEISSIRIDNDLLDLTLKGTYKYTVSYQNYSGEAKTHDDTDSDIFYATVGYLNGEFYITEISGLNLYFSQY